MKYRILTGLVVLLVTLLIARPAAADDPKPDRDVSELEKAGVLRPFGESSAGPKDTALGAGPLSSAGGAKVTDSVRVFGFTYLRRGDTQVRGRGISFTDDVVLSEVYAWHLLCRNDTCTGWVTRGGANRSFAVAGWNWTSGPANWTARSGHYFRDGNQTSMFMTSSSGQF